MDELVIRDGLYYKKFSDVPFTGKVDGQEQGLMKNGKRDGSWVTYYNNGDLSTKGDYKNGKSDGSWVGYKQDGTLWKEFTGTFKNGKRITD